MPRLPEQVDPIPASVEAFIYAGCAILIAGTLTLAVVKVREYRSADEMKHHEFIARCIEKHTEERCQSFYKYNRKDLGQ